MRLAAVILFPVLQKKQKSLHFFVSMVISVFDFQFLIFGNIFFLTISDYNGCGDPCECALIGPVRIGKSEPLW